MAQELMTLYKLIILYMLDQVNFPLTTAQVSDFVLGKEYTDFLSLQNAQSELIDVGFIRPETVRNRTYLHITDAGKETLGFFSNRISAAIKKDIADYFREREMQLRNEHSISANFYKSTSGAFEVRMTAKEENLVLVDLTLSVPNQEMAQSMCEKWEQNNQEIYQYLMEWLL